MRYIKRDRGMEKDLKWIANERGRERRTERDGNRWIEIERERKEKERERKSEKDRQVKKQMVRERRRQSRRDIGDI